MSENLNIADILNLVKESNKDFESVVYIPSLGKEVHFKPMNASHLKAIIKTSVSGVFANNIFNQSMFSIIKEILDPEVKVSEITNFDKLAILLQLRKRNVKNTVEVSLTSEDEKTKQITLDLDKWTNKMKKDKFSFDDQTIKDGSYEITLGFPSIEQENFFDNYFEHTRIKKTDENNKEALKELFGPLFIQEITQYIKSITIKEQQIAFNTLSIADRISVVENLSGSIITKMIETIDTNFGKQINKLLLVEKEIDGEKYKGAIEIGPQLFS